MTNERVYMMAFSTVYPLLVQKAERKGTLTSILLIAEMIRYGS